MIETSITKANLIPLFHITVYHYPLKNPKSDQNLISFHSNTAESCIEIKRIKKMITIT